MSSGEQIKSLNLGFQMFKQRRQWQYVYFKFYYKRQLKSNYVLGGILSTFKYASEYNKK